MKHIALPVLAALSLAACASTQDARLAEPRTPVGPATQENWEVGQAAYLMWNSQQRGWTVTPSGLQYRRVGKANPMGEQPTATDTVKVHYRGTFIDGREFDYLPAGMKDQAAAEPIYETIEGWSESTQGARSWKDLPANAIKYVRRIEELIGAPVALLSTSPERDDTILMRDPFQG